MKKIIWTNDVYLEDYEDYFREEGITDKEEKMKEMYLLNELDFEAEMVNLDIKLPGKILVIACLGLWNGRRSGYKIMDNNLNEILTASIGDLYEVYFDGHNIKAKDAHHDGINYYEFRLIRNDRNIDILLEKIYNDDFSRQDINNYTKSLAPYIKEVYGW